MLVWLPPVLAALALLWVAALAAAPLLPVPLAAVLYAAGSLICHQLPDRSFYLQTFQLPVCARCLGLYAGGALGALAVAVVRPRRPRPSSTRARILITAAAAPTAVTMVMEHVLGFPLSNEIRALAALPFAAVVAFVMVGAAQVFEGATPDSRPLGSRPAR